MSLSQVALSAQLLQSFAAFPTTSAQSAQELAAAYHAYAQGGSFGVYAPLLTGRDVALASTLTAGMTGAWSAFASAWQSGLTAYWAGVVVVGAGPPPGNGAVTEVPGAASVSAALASLGVQPYVTASQQAADAIAAALHSATATAFATITLTTSPTPTVITPTIA